MKNPALRERDSEVGKFLAALQSTPRLWRSLDVRVICVKHQDRWHNLLTRCVLHVREPNIVPRLSSLPKTTRTACHQAILPYGELKHLLRQMQAGEFQIAGANIIANVVPGTNATGSAERTPYSRAVTWLPGHADVPSRVGAVDVVSHRLEIRAGGNHGPLNAHLQLQGELLNRELRLLPQPWNGVSDLVRVALRSTGDPTRNDELRIEIVAPLGAGILEEHTSLNAGELKGLVWVASPRIATHCTVGYIAELEGGGYLNGSVPLTPLGRSNKDNTVPLSLSLPGETRRLTLLLRLGSYVVQTLVLKDLVARERNSDFVSYSTLDEGLLKLSTALALTELSPRSGKKDAAQQFEGAVARLFSIAGFHSDMLDAYAGMNETIDVVARTPDRTVVVAIECTLGALQSADGKPDRLRTRAAAIAEALEHNAEVICVIATSRKRKQLLASELEGAAIDGFSILCNEDLVVMLESIENGATPSDLVRYCRKAVPGRADNRPLAHLVGHVGFR